MGDGLSVLLVILGIIVFIGLVIVFWVIGTLNTFRKLIIKVDEAESGIDVALTKRFDLLTKMVSATKGYAEHERKNIGVSGCNASTSSWRINGRKASIC